MNTSMKITAWIFFCFFTLISCDTTDCISFSTRVLVVEFLDDSTGVAIQRDVEFITSTESSVIFYGDTTLSVYYLPVNTEKDRTTFLFFNPDSSVDTLEIGYDRSERLISKDCGIELQFKNIRIIDTSFDHAVSLENELSRLNEENVKIYL